MNLLDLNPIQLYFVRNRLNYYITETIRGYLHLSNVFPVYLLHLNQAMISVKLQAWDQRSSNTESILFSFIFGVT